MASPMGLKIINNTSQLSYAARVNQTYHSDEDKFVTVADRLQEMYAKDPELFNLLKSLAKGMVAALGYESYQDLIKDMVGMGEIQYAPVTVVDINDTMQRWPDCGNLLDIVGEFDPSYINRIRTYLDSHRKDKKVNRHVAWDGQHTVLALYVIAVLGFGCDPEDVLVPVDQYPGDDRAAIRRRFVEFNSGKTSKKLDNIDLYKQYVAGMFHDRIEDFWNVRCYTMQKYFEQYGYYATDEKFGDEKNAGAWSRMTEVFNRNFPVEIFERVMYYHSITNNDKPFVALEIDNMSVFIRQCLNDGIDVTDQYLDDIAKIMSRVTENTWAVDSRKHRMVQRAYQSHVEKEKKAGRLVQGQTYRCNQTKVAPEWIKQTLAANGFKHTLPCFPETYAFDPETLV
jgi:hypothetical protein